MKKIVGAIIVFATMVSSHVMALGVSPMGFNMDPARSQYETVVALNNSDRNVTVEATVQERTVDANGNPIEIDNQNDILVFPPIVQIKPGASQSFRVMWTGEQAANRKREFYVVINQLPIAESEISEADKGQITLRLGFAFRVAVSVAGK